LRSTYSVSDYVEFAKAALASAQECERKEAQKYFGVTSEGKTALAAIEALKQVMLLQTAPEKAERILNPCSIKDDPRFAFLKKKYEERHRTYRSALGSATEILKWAAGAWAIGETQKQRTTEKPVIVKPEVVNPEIVKPEFYPATGISNETND